MRSVPHAIKDFVILRACESFASLKKTAIRGEILAENEKIHRL
jgi:hypothetical protein